MTFNAHRIHYDPAFAIRVERYPGIIVHGPLLALALAGLGERHLADAPRRFEFRAVSPVFVGTDIVLTGGPGTTHGADLEAYTSSGRLTMTARMVGG